MFIDITKVFIL